MQLRRPVVFIPRRLLLTGLCLLAVLLGVTVIALAAEAPLAVTLASSVVPQGGIVLLRIAAANARRVTVQYANQIIAADDRGDGQWEAALGVWMEEPAGPRAVQITAVAADGWRQTATATFTITARSFPVQRLRMSVEQESRYTAPSVQEEYRLIGTALQHQSPRAWRGALLRPTLGRLSTRFGVRRFRNGKRVGIHKGLDIAAPAGTPITAAAAGIVVLRRKLGLHGNVLLIDHGGGLASLYIHLRDFTVREGDHVAAGQTIAHVGATGATTGPNLHYAVYIHGIAVDPLLCETMPAGW